MEAARILIAAKVKPKRTIRFMLWSGEEQGLLGSKAYVLKHAKEVNETVSAVFVHDGGTNYCSGIICTPAMKEDFEKVFAPVMKLDERAPFEIQITQSMRARAEAITYRLSKRGVPGFFWKQAGRATYRTTHHTQFDTYDSVGARISGAFEFSHCLGSPWHGQSRSPAATRGESRLLRCRAFKNRNKFIVSDGLKIASKICCEPKC